MPYSNAGHVPRRSARAAAVPDRWAGCERLVRTALGLPGGDDSPGARNDAAAKLYQLMYEEAFHAAVRAGSRCPREVAEVAVQVWWTGVATVARTYTPGRPLLPYVRQSLRYIAIATAARRRRPHADVDGLAIIDGRADDPAAVAERRDLVTFVRKAVRRLPARYRAALELRFDRGMTSAEAAAELGVPKATLDVWVFRALTTVRQSLVGLA